MLKIKGGTPTYGPLCTFITDLYFVWNLLTHLCLVLRYCNILQYVYFGHVKKFCQYCWSLYNAVWLVNMYGFTIINNTFQLNIVSCCEWSLELVAKFLLTEIVYHV